MIQRILHFCFIVTILLGTSSCAKMISTHEYLLDKKIQFSSREKSTKALDEETILLPGNKFLVYDFLTGTTTSGESRDVHYILNQEIESPKNCSEGMAWTYNGGTPPYYWLLGTHKLFGYNTYDMSTGESINDLFGSEEGHKPVYNSTDKELYLPEIELTEVSPQFDMVYSDIVTRKITVDEGDTSVVPLDCSHLFGRFLITAQNVSSTTPVITLKSLYIQGLKTQAKATISFEGEHSSASLNDLTAIYKDSENRTFCEIKNNNGQGYTLNQGNEPTIIVSDHMMWPQTLLTNIPDIQPPIVNEQTGEPIFDKRDILIVLEYQIGTNNYRRAIRFPNPETGIEPGKVHQVNIIFSDKLISTILTVRPWTWLSESINYENEIAADASSRLKIDTNTCLYDEINHIAQFKDTGEDIVFRFHLDKPDGGRWMVALTGDFDAFMITQGSYGPVGQDAEIHINSLSGVSNVSCQLKISVIKATGEIITADDVLQREYKITIKK